MDYGFLGLIILDWAELALRWLHIITAIAWIGSSFYFIALDLGLRQSKNLPELAYGDEWQVHGGGFYHIQKYLVAPPSLPEHLTWFKWESYATFLSGFALLVLIYYFGADIYLLDTETAPVPIWGGIIISLSVLIFGWLGYDVLCRSRLGNSPTSLMLALYVILIGLAYLLDQIFTGRAAFLHLGAVTATIMSFNVLFIIIPNQKIVVAELKAGKVPDAKYGQIAKLRSTHNNYLTLPVIFFMLSNHYPLSHSTDYSWLIASLVFLMGVSIRHYFNSRHARVGNPVWTWALTAGLFVIIICLSLAPLFKQSSDELVLIESGAEREISSPFEQKLADFHRFEDVRDIIEARCTVCHTEEPYFGAIRWPPKGLILDTDGQIVTSAYQIITQSVLSDAMPPGNVSYMEAEERALLLDWYHHAFSAAK